MEDILIADSPLIKNLNALIPGHLKTLSDLNEWESSNILEAQRLFFSTPKKRVFTSELIQKLHKKMFDRTWAWAGIYRSRDLFEGLSRHLISKNIYELCIDLAHWQNKHMNIIEQSVRLHHTLAGIRAFEGGNLRHARMMADLLLYTAGHKRPSWPDSNTIKNTDFMKKYGESMKLADRGDYEAMLELTWGLMK